jgi:DNA-binding response OmpR family regulator
VRVEVVRWPAEEHKRAHCLRTGTPRLILVEDPHVPPAPADALEDWVRLPARRDDVQRRIAMLSQRAAASAPAIEDDVLRFRGYALPLRSAEVLAMHRLVHAYRSVVQRQELEELLWPDDALSHRNALDLRIHRLRQRIRPTGLVIRTVRSRGYMLDHTPER